MDRFSETTIGYRTRAEGVLWQALFQTPQFRVQLIDDVAGVSLCGALKSRLFSLLRRMGEERKKGMRTL